MNHKKSAKIIIIMLATLLLTGCQTTLTNKDKEARNWSSINREYIMSTS